MLGNQYHATSSFSYTVPVTTSSVCLSHLRRFKKETLQTPVFSSFHTARTEKTKLSLLLLLRQFQQITGNEGLSWMWQCDSSQW